MKLPWLKSEQKSSASLIALAHLPGANWGRVDAATLIRDGYSGNAVAYRCVRMIAEAAASIQLKSDTEQVQNLLREPSPEESGQALLERLYTDLQITGNAWAEAVTLLEDEAPRGVFGLRPDCVRANVDRRGHVSGYRVKTGRAERIINREPDGWIPVLHLKLYHPADAQYGLSPLAAARKALDLHNSAAGWAKALPSLDRNPVSASSESPGRWRGLSRFRSRGLARHNR